MNDIFAASMVDVAGVAGVEGGAVLVAVEDATRPKDADHCQWLCEIIRQALAGHGMTSIGIERVPTNPLARTCEA